MSRPSYVRGALTGAAVAGVVQAALMASGALPHDERNTPENRVKIERLALGFSVLAGAAGGAAVQGVRRHRQALAQSRAAGTRSRPRSRAAGTRSRRN